MLNDTVSLLLRPKCTKVVHHAPISSFLLRNDISVAHNLLDTTLASSESLNKIDRAVITGSRDGTIHIASLNPYDVHSVLQSHTGWISSLCMLADNRTVISSAHDGLIKIWDIESAVLTQTLHKHKDFVECISYSSHHKLLASAGLSDELYLWRIDSQRAAPSECLCISEQHRENSGSFYALDMCRFAPTIATGGTDQVVRLWDTRIAQCTLKLLGHRSNVRDVHISDDGMNCISLSTDGCIKVWDSRSQRCKLTHYVQPAPQTINFKNPSLIWTMSVTENQSHAFTGGSGKNIYLTDLVSGSTETFTTLNSSVAKLHFDASQKELWASTSDSNISRYDVSNISVQAKDEDDDDDPITPDEANSVIIEPSLCVVGCPAIRKVRIIDDGWHVLSQNTQGSVQLWDIINVRLVKSYGVVPFDDLFARKNQSNTKSMPSWFTVDVRLGCLMIILDKRTVFNAIHTVLTPPLPDPTAPVPVAAVINLGASCLATIFTEWKQLEEIALRAEGSDFSSANEHDISLLRSNTSSSSMNVELLALSRAVSDGNTPISNTSGEAVIGVTSAVIIQSSKSLKQSGVQVPIYISLPIPPLPTILRPHLSNSGSSREMEWEEALVELDRKRALYHYYIPPWVEQVLFKEMTSRAHAPPPDVARADLFDNIMEWTNNNDNENDTIELDNSDNAKVHINIIKIESENAENLITSAPQNIPISSIATRSASAVSLSGIQDVSEASAQPSPPFQAVSNSDKNKTITFQILPVSPELHNNNEILRELSLPSVIRGSLQVPYAMTVRRITAYLCAKLQKAMSTTLNNSTDNDISTNLPVTIEQVQILCEGHILPLDSEIGSIYDARSKINSGMTLYYQRVKSSIQIHNTKMYHTPTPAKRHELPNTATHSRISISKSFSSLVENSENTLEHSKSSFDQSPSLHGKHNHDNEDHELENDNDNHNLENLDDHDEHPSVFSLDS